MKRSKMAKSSFALPAQKKYPVHDLAHARNALSRVGQHGSPAQKKAVYSAVKKRYPGLAKRSTVIATPKAKPRSSGRKR